MANFIPAYERTNGNEGGLSNDPHDKGGFTYGGISEKYWRGWKGFPIVHSIVAKHNGDFKLANKELANNQQVQDLKKAFYMSNFWNVLSLSYINDQQLANNIYDFEVNAGTGESAFAIQKACNDLGCNLKVDGAVGKLTIRAINAINPKQLYDAFNSERLKYYKSLNDWKYYEDSWTSRIIPYVNLT